MEEVFWRQLRGFFCLAPMEDVTDTVFREIVLLNSDFTGLKVVFTEFLSTDGFCHPIGRNKVLHRFKINDSELKILKEKNVKLVAQIWGTNPVKFKETAKYISEETPFDGIDINMGCPQKNIIKKGACSALINTPAMAREIIQATVNATHLPVSVKTRIGFRNKETESWISHLLDTDIKALTVHGRIQKQMSDGEADWNEILKVNKLRNSINPDVVIIGNGDIKSVEDGYSKMNFSGVDGVMVGRGIFNDFWMFNGHKESIDFKDKLNALYAHASLFTKTWEGEKSWNILKRFFKIYTYNLPNASYLRDMLMNTNNIDDLREVLFLYSHRISIPVEI